MIREAVSAALSASLVLLDDLQDVGGVFKISFLLAVVSIVVTQPTLGLTFRTSWDISKGLSAAAFLSFLSLLFIDLLIQFDENSPWRTFFFALVTFSASYYLVLWIKQPIARKFALAILAVMIIAELGDSSIGSFKEITVSIFSVYVSGLFGCLAGIPSVLVFPRFAVTELKTKIALASVQCLNVIENVVEAFLHEDEGTSRMLLLKSDHAIASFSTLLDKVEELLPSASDEMWIAQCLYQDDQFGGPKVIGQMKEQIASLRSLLWTLEELHSTVFDFNFDEGHFKFLSFYKDSLKKTVDSSSRLLLDFYQKRHPSPAIDTAEEIVMANRLAPEELSGLFYRASTELLFDKLQKDLICLLADYSKARTELIYSSKSEISSVRSARLASVEEKEPGLLKEQLQFKWTVGKYVAHTVFVFTVNDFVGHLLRLVATTKPKEKSPSPLENVQVNENLIELQALTEMQKLVSAESKPANVSSSRIRMFFHSIRAFLTPHNLSRRRLLIALRIALAITLASLTEFIPAASDYFENGFWAPLTVAFVSEDTLGSSFQSSIQRLQGTVIGAVYGYLALSIAKSNRILLVFLLVLIVIPSAAVRAGNRSSYAGLVTAFTAAIIMLALDPNENDDIRALALVRIEQTFIGISAYLVTMHVVAPIQASKLSRSEVIYGLKTIRIIFADIFRVYDYLAQTNTTAEVGTDVKQQLKVISRNFDSKLAELLSKLHFNLMLQEKLFLEASLEPEIWKLPFQEKTFQNILRIEKSIKRKLARLGSIVTRLFTLNNESKLIIFRTLKQTYSDLENAIFVHLSGLLDALESEDFVEHEAIIQLHRSFENYRNEHDEYVRTVVKNNLGGIPKVEVAQALLLNSLNFILQQLADDLIELGHHVADIAQSAYLS